MDVSKQGLSNDENDSDEKYREIDHNVFFDNDYPVQKIDIKSNSSKSKRCYFFFKSGHCNFGNRCKFIHHTAAGNDLRKQRQHQKRKSKSSKACGFANEEPESSNICGEKSSVGEASHSNLCPQDENSIEELIVKPDTDSAIIASESKKENVKFHSPHDRASKIISAPLCYYFKKGYCYRGNHCKFYHQNIPSKQFLQSNISEIHQKLTSLEESNVSKTDSNFKEPNQISETFNGNRSVHKPSLIQCGSVSSLRSTEITQLKKRFPHYEEVLFDKTFAIMFEPSDPDWPFDLRKVKIQVHFPESYPEERCTVSIMKHAENIPDLLIKFLNNSISDWISTKYEDKGSSSNSQLIFRPFLKWLDKNLEELFICGLRKVKQDIKAKECGIEFVPVEDLFPSTAKTSSPENSNQEEAQESDNVPNKNIDCTSSLVSLLSQTSISTSKPVKEISNKQYHCFGNNIMKVVFTELELIEGAAALVCSRVSLTLQCCRCKFSFHSKSAPKKNNVFACSKCSKNLGFTMESCMIHPFSNVLGNLYLLDCVAVDLNLTECHFLVDCLSCSKQVPVDSIHYGQKHKLWCTFCHGKMMITIGSVKFQTVKRSSLSESTSVPIKRNEKKIKDPVIKEGEPLPDFGGCKHYKKSYRWLRFPCCGRLYPCDECHNEKETNHEMKFASRMVCGFCSKEQPYTKDRPCHSCSQSMTKKSGCHWEGGKGCRNKIQMCREDKQKYVGTCKTVSKKAQGLKKAKTKS